MQFDIESCSTPALEMPALSFGTAVAVQTRIARCLKSDATAEQWPRLQVLHFTFESAIYIKFLGLKHYLESMNSCWTQELWRKLLIIYYLLVLLQEHH